MGKIGVLSMPTVGMVMAECAQVGLMMFSKAAMSNGMSNLIFVFYSNALASLVLLPISFFFHRYSLTFSALRYIKCPFGCFNRIFTYFVFPLSEDHSVLRLLYLFFLGVCCLVFWGKLLSFFQFGHRFLIIIIIPVFSFNYS